MIAVFVNALAIFVGGGLGLSFRRLIPQNTIDWIMNVVAIMILIMGIEQAIQADNFLIQTLCLLLGGFIGEGLDLYGRLERSGERLKKIFRSGDARFTEGLVTAFMIQGIGALGIVGSMEAGIAGNYDLLYFKSLIDGVTAVLFAATYGAGAVFSGALIFVYQGMIVIASGVLGNFLDPFVVDQISCMGSVLLIMLGLQMLKLLKIKTINLLPSMLLIGILYNII